MNRRQVALMLGTAAGALALGAGVALLRVSSRGSAAKDADPLFASTFPDADGNPNALSRWRGSLLVVNFWATWCAPCVEEMPALNRIRNEYYPRVEVIGLGIDSAEKIRGFRDRYAIKLPLLVAGAAGSDLARALGNTAGVLPYTVLIGRSGAIERRRVGQIQATELRSWLQPALARIESSG